ncbi:heparinase II/III domain-containing protein [Coraliomargarita parva]|uniref:heparinase II/III domain-containing protein n=1 Tax=Coraliomargarita parva TaxID=3014050 RepID=UPI0022B2C97E|nr:heparinase II/III family protein [Coraliomargarita parva]
MSYPFIIALASLSALALNNQCPAASSIPNPGFENQLEGWETHPSGDLVSSGIGTGFSHSGESGLRVADKDPSSGCEIRSARFPVTPDATYRLTFWGRGMEGKGLGVYLVFVDSKGNWLGVDGSKDGATLTLPEGETPWVPLSITAKAPGEAAKAFVRIHSYGQALVTADIDDFAMDELSPEEAAQLPENWMLSQERVKEIEGMMPQSLSGSMCGPGIDDRAAWEDFGKRVGPELLERADAMLNEPVPDASDELFLTFSRTGTRPEYEKPFRDRRVRLRVLTLAECIRDEGKYLPAIEKTLEAILKEKTWVLPAHDAHLDNFEGRVVDIDLGVAVRGATVATSVAWLGDRLSSDLRKHALAELDRRIFTPYLTKVHEGPRGKLCWWTHAPTNWNPVCHSQVVIAAMDALTDVHRRAEIVAGAEHFVKRYYDGFPLDGYCTEGLGYWDYGFGHYVLLAETLLRVTGGEINLYEPAIIGLAAQYPKKLKMAGNVYPSFADCPRYPKPFPWITDIIQYRYEGKIRDSNRRLIDSAFEQPAGGTLSEISVAAFPLTEFGDRPDAISVQKEESLLRTWFPSGGVFICRSVGDDPEVLEVAIKGGHNGETHNHNDVGGFVLALKGRSPIIDPGRDIYSKFDSYETVDLKGSQGHSVPRIAGKNQRSGRYALAEVISHQFTEDTDTIVLDLSRLYDVPELMRLERKFSYSRKNLGSLTVIDTVEFSRPQTYENAFITYGAVTMTTDKSALIVDGDSVISLATQADGNPSMRFKIEPLQTIIPRPPLRILASLPEPVLKATIRYELNPAKKEWASYVENRDPEATH